MMDLEIQGGNSTRADVERPQLKKRGCFPLEPFRFCPGFVTILLPRTYQKIQDGTHFALVMGVLALTAMMVQQLLAHLLFHSEEWLQTIFAVFFFILTAPYCYRIIGQYDEQLQTKQKQAKMEKENLTKAYHDLLSDMDGLLAKSAESACGLAERSFESKRRDFQRFLERAAKRYSKLYSGSKGECDQLLKQFKRFCINWLRVFEECSIDPGVVPPNRELSAEAINRCQSIEEVADFCLRQLRITEVRFISIRRDEDAQMLRKQRGELRRLSVTNNGGARQLALPAPNGAVVSAPPMQHMGSFQPPASFAAAVSVRERRCMSWFKCGRSSCEYSTSDSSDGFPKTCGCVCARLVLLSRDHAQLMLGFFFGICVGLQAVYIMSEHAVKAGAEDASKDLKSATPGKVITFALIFAETAIAMISLLVCLVRFEDIDVIQQLEREVKELVKQNEHVEGQREKMREFWTSAQNLTELWLYRTVPRLDLLKEMHSQLEEASQEDLLMHISGANQCMEDLDRKLGAIKAWRNDGELRTEDKKAFGKAINNLCQEQDFVEILNKLTDVSSNHMGTLQPKELPPIRDGDYVQTV